MRGYPQGTRLYWKEEGQQHERAHSRHFADFYDVSSFPRHVTVSQLDVHNARAVCEFLALYSTNSVAVNHKEKLFCDMCRKQFFEPCDEEVTTASFDLKKMILRNIKLRFARESFRSAIRFQRRTD